MTRPTAACFFLATALTVLSGCNPAPSTEEAPPPPAVTESPPPPPPAPPAPAAVPIPVATELALDTVGSVMLSRPADDPMAVLIEVSGTAISPGWTKSRLVEELGDPGDGSIKTYRLLATSPELPIETRRSTPMTIVLRVESLPPEVKTIRILAESNEISAPVTQ